MNPTQFVEVFKAKTQNLDQRYIHMAQYLRDKALSQYHCQKFESVTEKDFEITLTYWNSLENVYAWLLEAEHQIAQNIGKEKWYAYFSVEICEIKKSYQSFIE